MLSVHQHWDPLKVCAVGKSYPPEFYSRIKNPKVRNVLERIAIETEEDYQNLIALLEKFNVKVLRTDVSDNPDDYVMNGVLNVPPPMCPRDYTAMIGDTFYMPGKDYGDNLQTQEILSYLTDDKELAKKVEDFLEPNNMTEEEALSKLKSRICHDDVGVPYMRVHDNDDNRYDRKTDVRLRSHQQKKGSLLLKEIISAQTQTIGSNFKFPNHKRFSAWTSIENWLKEHDVPIVYDTYVNSACTTRVGKDLFFTTMNAIDELYGDRIHERWKKLFPDYNVHLLHIGGHSDGTYCPVVPGLIISLFPQETYKDTFPDWEVITLPQQSWAAVKPFLRLKEKNKGRWWVPGEEDNDALTNYVEQWLNDWVTYVEETVFDVNMLVIDKNNVVVSNYNKKVFDTFKRYNITPHVCPFRHRYFWDGGIHCITSDIAREGKQENLFA